MRGRVWNHEMSHENNVIIKFHISGICAIVFRVILITFIVDDI